jgi:hypothetical protein
MSFLPVWATNHNDLPDRQANSPFFTGLNENNNNLSSGEASETHEIWSLKILIGPLWDRITKLSSFHLMNTNSLLTERMK